MNKTRVGGVVVAAVALALTAACSSSGTTGGAATTGAAPSGAGTTAGCSPVTINYWHAYSSDGPEVKQLETVLAGAGYHPGPVDELYTEETRFALAQWQAAHGYPGATPEHPETVTVSLGQAF